MKSEHCTLRIGVWLAGSVGAPCSMGSGSLEGASAAGRRDRWLPVIQVLKIDVNVHQIGHWLDPAVRRLKERTPTENDVKMARNPAA